MKKTQLSLEDIQNLHQTGHLKEAERGYLKILATDPKEVKALHLLGILYAEQEKFTQAQTYLQRAVDLEPQNPVFSLHLANVLKAAGLFNQAVETLKEITQKHPRFAAGFNNLGTVFFAQAKLAEAVSAYQAAIDIQPNYVDAYYNLGLALDKLNRKKEAINTYQALLELSPAHPGGHFQLGCLLMQQSNYPKAAENFEAIEKDHPFHFETQTNLATSYLKMGRLNQAKDHYLKALTIMPNDLQILFNLGVINMQQGQIDAAIDFYQRAADLDADNYDVQHNLAFAYLTCKNTSAALKHYREALRLQPNNESVRHIINILTQDKTITTSPIDYVRSLFDSYADHFDAHLTKILHYQVPKHLYDAFRQAPIAIKKQSLDILDLGCGTGLCGEYFRPFAKRLVGVDISEKMLEVAAQKNLYDELVVADLVPYLADKHAQWDVVLAGDVLVYFGDLRELFKAVALALKPQGIYIFNCEISMGEDFYMTPSGRFAHAKTYLEQLAKEAQLSTISYVKLPMRTEDKKVIEGHLFVLQKPV